MIILVINVDSRWYSFVLVSSLFTLFLFYVQFGPDLDLILKCCCGIIMLSQIIGHMGWQICNKIFGHCFLIVIDGFGRYTLMRCEYRLSTFFICIINSLALHSIGSYCYCFLFFHFVVVRGLNYVFISPDQSDLNRLDKSDARSKTLLFS